MKMKMKKKKKKKKKEEEEEEEEEEEGGEEKFRRRRRDKLSHCYNSNEPFFAGDAFSTCCDQKRSGRGLLPPCLP